MDSLLSNVLCVPAKMTMVPLYSQTRAESLAPGVGSTVRNRYSHPNTLTSHLPRHFKKIILEFGKGAGDLTWPDSPAQIAKQLGPI